MVDRFCLFNQLSWFQRTLLFLGSLGFMFGIALLGSLFFTWIGMFMFFCSWITPVREKFDRIDKVVCKDGEKKFEFKRD